MSKVPSDLIPYQADLIREVEAQLVPHETIVAWFAPDLDADLHFARGLVVLTDERIISSCAIRATVPPAADALSSLTWQIWPIDTLKSMTVHSRAGVGSLRLDGHEGQLAAWSFTPAQEPAARNLVERFNAPPGVRDVVSSDGKKE